MRIEHVKVPAGMRIAALLLLVVGATSPPLLSPHDNRERARLTEPAGSGTVFHILQPPPGEIYHAVFPGSESGDEDRITRRDLFSYEHQVGKPAAFVFFSNEWFRSRHFPAATAGWIRDEGRIPYIRLMLRSDPALRHREPQFTLARIASGFFDDDLRSWGRAARAFAYPLVVEYGTEVNGDWFSWNGVWNGGGESDGYGDPSKADGPELFRHTYRHIIRLMREEGALNITWVFHVNAQDAPDTSWNRFEAYYPGNSWIDWIAVSVYGAQTPLDADWPEFRDLMDAVYPRLLRLAAGKPIVVAEFGVTAGDRRGDQARWAERALTDLANSRWPHVIAFSWWNSSWKNDNNLLHNSDMRIQNNPGLGEVFRMKIGNDRHILGRALWREEPDGVTDRHNGTEIR